MDQKDIQLCKKFIEVSIKINEKIAKDEKLLIEALLGNEEPTKRISTIKKILLQIKIDPLEPLSETTPLDFLNHQFLSPEGLSKRFQEQPSDDTNTLTRLQSITDLMKSLFSPFLSHKDKLDKIADCVKSDNLTVDQKLDQVTNILL